MKIQTRCFLLLAALALAAGPPLQATDRSIVAGRGDGWEEFARDHLLRREGRWGTLDLILQDNEYAPTAETDLLMHFEPFLAPRATADAGAAGAPGMPVRDETGHYAVTEARLHIAETVTAMGAGAAAFSGGESGLRLRALPGALLASGTVWEDFSLEFWLYPALLADGEQVLTWVGSRWQGGEAVPQSIACLVEDRRLSFRLENLFVRPDGTAASYALRGLTPMIPKTWRHHLLRFDASRGLLEYLVDGIPEAVVHTTSDGGEAGDLFAPAVGDAQSGELVIGRDFVGFLDELRLSRSFVQEPSLTRYGGRTGVAMSNPFDLGYTGTRLKRIEAVYDTPSDSGVYFFYRLSDRWDLAEGQAPWTPFKPGQELREARGRYLQIRVELLPDGRRSRTPRVSELRAVYEQDLPPPPPSGLYAAAEDGAIHLFWNTVNEADVRGYLVYYGEAPGNYHGDDSALGPSPIDVGNVSQVRITGLRNRKLYYFSVVAYDATTPPHRSLFSKETSARPAEMHAAALGTDDAQR